MLSGIEIFKFFVSDHLKVSDGSFFCIFHALSFELNFFFDRRFPLRDFSPKRQLCSCHNSCLGHIVMGEAQQQDYFTCLRERYDHFSESLPWKSTGSRFNVIMKAKKHSFLLETVGKKRL